MKFAIALLLAVGTASAYTPPILATVKSKKQQLVATPTSGVPFNVPSEALPWSNAPATLDGSLIGDVGFDPVGFSTCNMAEFFDKGATDSMSNVQWMREAEIAHGRIAQLAVLGFIIPALVGTFPGNDWTGTDVVSQLSGAFVMPEYTAKAGYFLPVGI